MRHIHAADALADPSGQHRFSNLWGQVNDLVLFVGADLELHITAALLWLLRQGLTPGFLWLRLPARLTSPSPLWRVRLVPPFLSIRLPFNPFGLFPPVRDGVVKLLIAPRLSLSLTPCR